MNILLPLILARHFKLFSLCFHESEVRDEIFGDALEELLENPMFVSWHLDQSWDPSQNEKEVFHVWMPEQFDKDGVTLDSSSYWLVPSTVDLTTLPLRLDSMVYQYETVNETIKVNEVYAFRNGRRHVQEVGRVDLVTKNFIQAQDLGDVWQRRSDLEGQGIVAGVTSYELFHYWDGVTYQGGAVEVLNMLAHQMNFSITYLAPTDGSFGGSSDGQHWTGVVGLLHRLEADLSVALLAMTIDRLAVIDYAHYIYNDRITLFTLASNHRRQLSLMAYVDVFTFQAWISLTLAIILLTLILWMSWKLTSSHHNTLAKSGVVLLALMIQRDLGIVQGSWSSKFIVMTSSVMSIITFAAYSGLLTSTMIFTPGAIQVKDFQDLLDQGLTIAVYNDSFTYHSFRNAPSGSELQKVYNSKMKNNPRAVFNDFTEAYQILEASEKNLIFTEASIIGHFANVMEVPSFQKKVAAPITMAFPLGSELKEIVNYHLRKMDRSGLLERIWVQWHLLPMQGHVGDTKQVQVLALAFSHVVIPFGIVALGVGVAIMSSVFETFQRYV